LAWCPLASQSGLQRREPLHGAHGLLADALSIAAILSPLLFLLGVTTAKAAVPPPPAPLLLPPAQDVPAPLTLPC